MLVHLRFDLGIQATEYERWLDFMEQNVQEYNYSQLLAQSRRDAYLGWMSTAYSPGSPFPSTYKGGFKRCMLQQNL